MKVELTGESIEEVVRAAMKESIRYIEKDMQGEDDPEDDEDIKALKRVHNYFAELGDHI